MSATSRNALLMIKCNTVAQQHKQFQFCVSGPSVFLVFWCTQYSLNHTTVKSLAVLSQEIEVDTPHCSSPYPSSHSAKCDEHLFYRHQFHDSTAWRLCEDL
jgi:hypothetical protein